MTSSRTSSLPSLAGADWLQWPGTKALFAALGAEGGEVRAVGGAVRDTLLARPVSEVDFATTAMPETVMKLAQKAGLKAVPTGLDHGTVTVVADSRGFEVTTLRKDVETYGRHAKVDYTGDWAADAARRDFTINALYADADGTLFDPLGAVGDIEARRVRFIGDARARVREDYLRILRFFRFNAELETGDFDARGLQACVRERAGLQGLSAERVHGEFMRLLCGGGVLRALWKMFDYGLLVPVLRAVPYLTRLERLIAIEAERDTGPDAVLRLAALALAVPEDAARLADTLRLSNAERKLLEHAARYRDIRSNMDETDVRGVLYDRGRDGCRAAALMAWASADGSGGAWRKLAARIDQLPVPEFPLQGAEIVKRGVPEGPAVGDILQRLEAQWIEGGFAAGKADLLKMAQQMAARKAGKT